MNEKLNDRVLKNEKYIKSKQKLSIFKFILKESMYGFLPKVPEHV